MAMHAAKIEDSPRLQKVLAFLRRVGQATTLEIIKGCDVCAVNSVIAELRANGYTVTCQPVKGKKGTFVYRLIEGEQPALFAGAA